MTTYLVTGATGFIGRRLVTRLSEMGSSVICLVYPNRRQSNSLPAVHGVIPVDGDSTQSLAQTLSDAGPEVVINLAAQGVSPETRDPQLMINGNIGVISKLIQGLSHSSPRVILHAGSWSEYADSNGSEPIDEDQPIWPRSVYGAAKASATMFGNALARETGLPFVTLRLFNVFGVGESPNRLIPYLIDRLGVSEYADLTPGDQIRDVTYVDDIVDAILLAGGAGLEPYTAYNVCSSRPTQVRLIAETVADIMHKPRNLLRFGSIPHRTDEPLEIVGDNTRFVDATGWKPKTTLETGVELMVAALSGTDGNE